MPIKRCAAIFDFEERNMQVGLAIWDAATLYASMFVSLHISFQKSDGLLLLLVVSWPLLGLASNISLMYWQYCIWIRFQLYDRSLIEVLGLYSVWLGNLEWPLAPADAAVLLPLPRCFGKNSFKQQLPQSLQLQSSRVTTCASNCPNVPSDALIFFKLARREIVVCTEFEGW